MSQDQQPKQLQQEEFKKSVSEAQSSNEISINLQGTSNPLKTSDDDQIKQRKKSDESMSVTGRRMKQVLRVRKVLF